ncbi:Pentatricopeptide repeat-containing protein [Platanthera zijinensis]|uniref:Pentatricopeptide repeat-containing protein n=1 Tax=Platanthera zijinensis TaxID=2320716 RepID=A0AAP0G210_9ASPA
MWAIRRASNPIRNQGCYILFNHTIYANTEVPSDMKIGGQYSRMYQIRGACRLTKPISHGDLWLGRSFAWSVNRSSQFATMPSDVEESSDTDGGGEGGSSELDLESSPETLKIKLLMAEDDNKLDCEGDIVEEDGGDAFEDTLGLPDAEADGKKEITKKITSSELLKIMGNHFSPNNALDQWVGGGNSLGPSEVSFVVLNLRKRGWYGKALQFMEWVEGHKHIEYGEREYASHLDLVVKVLGLHKAENYIKTIPESFRGELVYRTLLANCVVALNVKKAEEVFNKIRDLGFPISTFSFNQLLLLYKRVDPKKISDVLKLMEKKDAKPSLFTYRLLIDIKGQRYDISGMEEVIATMKAEGMEPDLFLQVTIAKHYAAAGKKEKAEKMARDMEGDDIAENRVACNLLLPLYASLGKIDDVERLWKVCEHNPQLTECFAAIEAWGKLGKVEQAEQVFEKMTKSWGKLSAKYYNVLLKVYANRGLLSKGKELAKRMSDDGCKIGPLTWDLLVKLYAEGGEVEKADSILQKATEGSPLKPLFDSYIHVLRKYADRGDIHNAEKIFHKLRQVGYVGRMKQYQLLLQAYINAKVPAYGFRERMKADNIFPNSGTLAQLRAVDAFKKTEISELLD